MANVPWEIIFSNQPLDEMVNIFTENFLHIINSNIPNKTITIDDGDAPWVTPPLKIYCTRIEKSIQTGIKMGGLLIAMQESSSTKKKLKKLSWKPKVVI